VCTEGLLGFPELLEKVIVFLLYLLLLLILESILSRILSGLGGV